MQSLVQDVLARNIIQRNIIMEMKTQNTVVVTTINQLKRAVFKLHETQAIVRAILDNTPDSLDKRTLLEEYAAISTHANTLARMLDELLEDF